MPTAKRSQAALIATDTVLPPTSPRTAMAPIASCIPLQTTMEQPRIHTVGPSPRLAATTPTVTLLNADGTIAGLYTGAYQTSVGKSNNGNGNCNGTISDAFCVQETGTGPLLQKGQALTFAFDLTCSGCSLLSSWDFMGSGNPASGTGNVYAITNWGTSTSMPEPSVALLYASTVAAGLVFAWRSRPLRRSTKL
jgi:hypothetical protein